MIKSYAFIIIFLAIAVLIVTGAHFLLYKFLVKLLAIQSQNQKTILGIILLFASLSLILSMLLIRWRYNLFTRWFYAASGVWNGMLIYLLIAIGATWLLSLLFNYLGITTRFLDFFHIGSAGILIAFLVAIYAVHNAYQIDIKNIRPEIKNLPVE